MTHRDPSWSYVSPSWAMLAHLGAMLAHLGAMLAHLGAMLAHLGAMLAHLGAMLAHPGPMLAHPGPMLAHPKCQKMPNATSKTARKTLIINKLYRLHRLWVVLLAATATYSLLLLDRFSTESTCWQQNTMPPVSAGFDLHLEGLRRGKNPVQRGFGSSCCSCCLLLLLLLLLLLVLLLLLLLSSQLHKQKPVILDALPLASAGVGGSCFAQDVTCWPIEDLYWINSYKSWALRKRLSWSSEFLHSPEEEMDSSGDGS